MTATTEAKNTCRTDEAFAQTLADTLRPMLADRARKVVRAMVEALDYDGIAEAILERDEFIGGNLGMAIAEAVNKHLAEEVFTGDVELPDGCEC